MNDTDPDSEPGPAKADGDAHDFTIVGLGASAGGIKALREFFAHVPADSGIAFVVILHLSSEHESHLAEVLQSSTPMPISQVRERTSIKPDCVYVIPPNRRLAIVDGALELSEFERPEERRAPIDFFFRTLGEAKRERAFGVILSGTGADGSSGLKRVKECGGCVYAQDPDESEYADMPRNAIATGLVDQVLPVAAMGVKISAYHQRLAQFPPAWEDAASEENALREIFTQLRVHTGHEFSNYKRSTLLRRIGRRANLRDLPSLAAYAQLLREHPDEIQSLLRDLLISVTNFFRDKAAFEALERDVIPRLFEGKGAGDEVRVWVTACATGEEAYSIAMLLAEHAAGLENPPNLQIFATDIDSPALAVARDGCYSDVATADIAPQRLQRFFVKDAAGYRVRRDLRDTVLFALHNLLRDPPFSRLDLVSCRNFLIYLNRQAQKRALDILHFASRPGGFAFFGAAESAEGASDAFIGIDKEHHIYQSRALAAHLPPQFPERSPIAARIGSRGAEATSATETVERYSFADLHLRLLEQYAPPSVVVNEDYDIVHLSEGAGRYLQLAGGDPSHNLLKVAHYDLRLDLRTALYQATQQRTSVEARGLTVSMDGGARTIDLFVRPVLRDSDTARGFILVIFADADAAPQTAAAERTARLAEPVAGQLEEELLRVKSRLRTTIEQHEIQAEEAMAANEELQAMNEELRSTGEELETGREELQSLNEELRTVNQELKIKIDELVRTNDDFQNLINATGAPTIFLDRGLRVKLFTASARDIFNLIPADKGRLLSDISSQLVYPGLLDEIEVKGRLAEREVETRGGRWYCMRVSPYRTIDNRLDGVVIAFNDITERKQAEAARIHFRALFESAPGLYVVVNPEDYRIVAVSDAFLRATLTERQTIVGRELFDAFADNPAEPWADGVRNLHESLERVKSSRRADLMAVQRYPMRRSNGGEFEERWWSPINSPVFGANGEIAYLILRVEDVTTFMQQRQGGDGENLQLLETRNQHMEAEIVLRAQDLQRSNEQLRASEDSYRLAAEQLKALNEKLEQRVADRTAVAEQRTTQLRALATQLTRVENKERQRIAEVLHDNLQQLLLSAKFRLRTLKSQAPQADFGPVLESLDESLIASRSLVAELRPPILYHAKLSEALRWLADRTRQQHGLDVEVVVFGREPTLDEDMKLLLFQSVRELLLNITKHAAVDRAQIRVGAWRSRWFFVRVSDNGSGFRFADNQERGIGNAGTEISGAESGSGTGLGLVAIRERIEVLGGSMVVRSTIGRGTRVVLRVPVERRSGERAGNPAEVLLLRRLTDRQEQAHPQPVARTRILLVDDHTMVREGLRNLIEDEADMQVVGEAQDGLQAIALAGELAPDVVLMDINMPGMDGIEATRRIKAAHPQVRVIGLSMHADAGVMNAMRAAGVSEYITKDTVSDALCAAIREQVKTIT